MSPHDAAMLRLPHLLGPRDWSALRAIARRVIARRHDGHPSELAVDQAAQQLARSIVEGHLTISLEPTGGRHGEAGVAVVLRYDDGLSARLMWGDLDVDPRGPLLGAAAGDPVEVDRRSPMSPMSRVARWWRRLAG